MGSEERNYKHQQQTGELYAAIGRFAVKFEHICHAMSLGVTFILHQDGLKNQRFANAVLEGMTAEPLRRVYGAIVAEAKADGFVAEEKKILSRILKRIIDITQKRNDVIHRTWFVGWASETQEDFSECGGFKFKNTNSGIEFRPLNYTAADFDSLSSEADELTKLVEVVNHSVMLSMPFTKNLSFNPEGTVHAPHLKKG